MTSDRPSRHLRRLAGLAAAGGLLAVASPATGQEATPPATPPAGTTTDAAPPAKAEPRYPLIREGSRLVQVRGLVDRDARSRMLRLTIDESDPQSPGHRLTLMPSSRLMELEMVLGAAADARVHMVVTGRVFVFDGHNYLLLTHPAVPDERMLLETPSGAEAADDDDEADDTEAETPVNRAESDDPIDRIAEELERSVAPAGWRPATRGAGGGGAVAGDARRALPEGSRLVDRRGKIRRSEGGGYTFVFDADAGGDSDPPMMLLPCRLLEQLSVIATRLGDDAAVLISGEVTTHDGRNFLLPSVYRVPRESSGLRP